LSYILSLLQKTPSKLNNNMENKITIIKQILIGGQKYCTNILKF